MIIENHVPRELRDKFARMLADKDLPNEIRLLALQFMHTGKHDEILGILVNY